MKPVRSISGLITVISLLFSAIWLCPAPAAAALAFAPLGQLTAEGLRVPGAMDLDAAGNLYVADARGGKVHKFSPYGSLLQSFDLQGTGRGLAVTPDGRRLYVARENAVVITDALSGAELGALVGAAAGAEFEVAGEIDLDAAGNVFVADVGAMRINVYTPAGQYRTSFGSVGASAGQFMQIGGMALNPAGQVVVTDSAALNAKVHVFTLGTDLQVLNVAAYANATPAYFGTPVMHAPRGLAFDNQGRGYFLEFITSQVRVSSASFGYLGAYTQAGYAAGQLNNVIDAIYDNVNKRLFVGCDTGRIVILGVDGGQNPVRINRAPGAAVPQSPIAGSEVASATPALVFQNASDADGDTLTYRVAVSQDEALVYEAEVAAQAGATTTAVVTVPLAENAAFTWTVQASDGELASPWSAAAGFVVNAIEEAPSTPQLSAPLAGEAIGGFDALAWQAATDPDPNDLHITYQVEVALDEDFSQIIATELLTDTTLSLNALAAYGDLVVGNAYFWRVAAFDETHTLSAPSPAGQFVYDTTSLAISANMPDASVSFHGNHAYAGQIVGVAPLELRDFTPGTLAVVVERAGFEPFVAQITLNEGDNLDLYAALVPAMAVGNLIASKNGINGRSGLSVNRAAAPFLVDFDNDGDLDLLVGDATGRVSLFANLQQVSNNRIAFDQGVSLVQVQSGAVPFVVDWNNDGRKDLLVGQADGTVKLFVNNGLEQAPAFAAAVDLQTLNGSLNAGSGLAPAVLDYNGDGNKDLLVGNAAGEVRVFLNQGSDAAPQLADSVVILAVDGAVVPMPVDWDADGQQELLLTANGVVNVYAKVDGVFQAVKQFGDKRSFYVGAFPIDFFGTGKQLLAGLSNGELVYLSGNSSTPVASFQPALLAKVDQLAGLVAEEAPQQLDSVAAIGALIAAGNYPAAALAAGDLALALPAGAAQGVALELAELCQ